MTTKPTVTFLYRAGRRARLAAPGEHPGEFFYGLPQLIERGWKADLLEDGDIGMAPPLRRFAWAIGKSARLLGGLPIGMAVSFLASGARQRLSQADVHIATTNGMGLALAITKSFGLHPELNVMLLAMGLLPTNPSRVQRLIFPKVLRQLRLVTLCRAEQEVLQRLLPGQRIACIPFGVDHRFWFPHREAVGESFVLSIGNDRYRDYATLIAAWKPHYPKLKIVTLQPVPNPGVNVDIIRGDWRTQVLGDIEIRSLYRQSMFVVLPIRQTIQPSGQSSCLQAMACGKAVILSDIDGLWNRELMRNDETILLTPPGDVAALAATIEGLLHDPGKAKRIGGAARTVIEEHLNVDAMADALTSVLAAPSSSEISVKQTLLAAS